MHAFSACWWAAVTVVVKVCECLYRMGILGTDDAEMERTQKYATTRADH